MAFQINLAITIAIGSLPLFVTMIVLLFKVTNLTNKFEDIDRRMLRAGYRIRNLEATQRDTKEDIGVIKKDVDYLKHKDAQNDIKDIYKK